jgi:2-polyprenyl-3-methyl-5-hydroxy-6-metoxy-1,4-benzoquinol methylase
MQSSINLKMKEAACCICENTDAVLLGKGEDFEYRTSSDTFNAFQCNTCGLVYLNPRPAITEFEKIYPPTYHAYDFSEKEFGFVHRVRSRLEAGRMLKHCRQLGADAYILDAGCGDGFHLKLLKKFGKATWKLEGIDIDKKAVEKGKQAGLLIHEGTVEEINLAEDRYNLVIMIMTIEHVENPAAVLQAVFRLLKKGGRIVIVTDNTGSLDFTFFKKRHWGGYHFPRHWNLFNRAALAKLAASQGFEVTEIKTIVSPVNWVYSIHNILADWKWPGWIVNRFTLKSTVSLAMFTLVDMVLQKTGRGAVLQATFTKPGKTELS